ncbi:MAG: class I SAM-dependent methyltransferase [archaeon]
MEINPGLWIVFVVLPIILIIIIDFIFKKIYKKSKKKWGDHLDPHSFDTKEEYFLFLQLMKVYEFIPSIIPKGKEVLDAGCGEGYGANYLAKKGFQVIAIDINKKTIIEARKKYRESCLFLQLNAEKLPYKNETFDAIMSSHVIEHLKNDAGYVKELQRVLKKGGKLILTTPNKKYRVKPGEKPWNIFHIKEYTADELEKILKTSFPKVTMRGVMGDEETQRVELERVKHCRKIARLDRFNLRRQIPPFLKFSINNFVRNILNNKSQKFNDFYLQKYNTNNFKIVKENLDSTINLVAVCEK